MNLQDCMPCEESELHPALKSIVEALDETMKSNKVIPNKTADDLFNETKFLIKRLWNYALLMNKPMCLVTNHCAFGMVVVCSKDENGQMLWNNQQIPENMCGIVAKHVSEFPEMVTCDRYHELWTVNYLEKSMGGHDQ